MKKFIGCFFTTVVAFNSFAQVNEQDKASKLVAKMTLEEKIKLVVGMGMSLPGAGGAGSGPAVGQTMNKVPGAAGTTFAISRLGIPTIVLADGPAGLRIQPIRDSASKKRYYCTAFPVGTLLASSWDTVMVKKVGEAMGNEVREYGTDIFLAPALNIQRNPLGGRNFEYYSEDPVVSGNIAAAMVNGIESNHVGASIKHYAANNQETNRNLVNTISSERALREIYLRGFEIAVKKSQPWTVMSSYNKINGTYTSQDYDLLTTILRKEWGFKGLVMTDWFGGNDAVAQMKAGNDLLMPGTQKQNEAITAAIKDGSLDIKVLDDNAARVVSMILTSPAYRKVSYSDAPSLKAHAGVARAAAAEGMILLKNELNTLPLKKEIKKIAVFGNISYDFISGGTGSGDVNEAYTISLIDGLLNAGIQVDYDLKKTYEKFIITEKEKAPKKKFFFELPAPLPEMQLEENMIAAKAKETDIALITIGRNAGEFQDRKEENDYYLSEQENNLVKKVSEAFHLQNKKVVVILNIGGVIDVTSWRESADAILLAWQGGQEGGNAVTDILSGKVTPSGKLPTTFPVSYKDEVSSKNFPGKNLSAEPLKGIGGFSLGYDSEVTYEEGIYVGYRYYTSFNVKTAYPFGYGLSYTDFEYSPVKLSTATFKGKITASVTIKNTGKASGKEVVQLYITAPSGKLHKPSMELKAFAKTKLLQTGQSQTLNFEINEKDLASFETESSSWVADAGNYIIKIGASSENILQTAGFNVPLPIIVEKCNKALVPKVIINELKK